MRNPRRWKNRLRRRKAVGYIIRGDSRCIYFSGDTNVFGDMKLIADLYNPETRVPAGRQSLHHGSVGGRGRRAIAARENSNPDALWDVPGANRNAHRFAGVAERHFDIEVREL